MEKGELLKKINGVEETKGRNSMGASESWYNAYYMVREFAKRKEIKLEELTLKEINNLIALADFAGEVFY